MMSGFGCDNRRLVVGRRSEPTADHSFCGDSCVWASLGPPDKDAILVTKNLQSLIASVLVKNVDDIGKHNG